MSEGEITVYNHSGPDTGYWCSTSESDTDNTARMFMPAWGGDPEGPWREYDRSTGRLFGPYYDYSPFYMTLFPR